MLSYSHYMMIMPDEFQDGRYSQSYNCVQYFSVHSISYSVSWWTKFSIIDHFSQCSCSSCVDSVMPSENFALWGENSSLHSRATKLVPVLILTSILLGTAYNELWHYGVGIFPPSCVLVPSARSTIRKLQCIKLIGFCAVPDSSFSSLS
ncbi:unnamed protein product [Citrullus colocynthis]|uniref:Uncharacterized protein n=1 Tax=Citrullus colocynthis TaxID=252529 RepID=A0ABP0YL18_9ROSI